MRLRHIAALALLAAPAHAQWATRIQNRPPQDGRFPWGLNAAPGARSAPPLDGAAPPLPGTDPGRLCVSSIISLTGAKTTDQHPFAITVHDNAAMGSRYSYPFFVSDIVDSTAATGKRAGATFQLLFQQPTANTTGSGNDYYVATSSVAVAGAPDNGTASAPQGNLYGANPVCRMIAGATNWHSCTGAEIDVITEAGSSMARRYGVVVSDAAGSVIQGSLVDAGLALAAAAGAPGFYDGILFDDSTGRFPVAAGGTLIKASTGAAVAMPFYAGLDLSNISGAWTTAPILLRANNGGIWWGAAHAGGAIESNTTTGGMTLSFQNRLLAISDGAGGTAATISSAGAATFTGGVTAGGVVRLKQYTVATLPACDGGAAGGLAYVTDANSTAFNATAAGGGANVMPVFCNGSAWVIH